MKRRVMKNGLPEWRWIELGGCGMIDPNVFKAVGIDPEEWIGFVFGLDFERVAKSKDDNVTTTNTSNDRH